MKIVDVYHDAKHFEIEDLGYSDLNLMMRAFEAERKDLKEYLVALAAMGSQPQSIIDETRDKIAKLDKWIEDSRRAMQWD